MEENTFSRRKFILRNVRIFTAFIGGTGLISGCGSGGNKRKTGQSETAYMPKSCDDLSGVNKKEIQKREKLSYVKETPVPGSDCGHCQFHIPGKYGADIGGCLLFEGPVCASGYCTQYAKAET